ncbi:hypothetical protein V8C42DRAFT_307470 [Trichoderma barbatum]
MRLCSTYRCRTIVAYISTILFVMLSTVTKSRHLHVFVLTNPHSSLFLMPMKRCRGKLWLCFLFFFFCLSFLFAGRSRL